MRPKSYRRISRRCQNCRYIAMAIRTVFLRKRGTDSTYCIKKGSRPDPDSFVIREEYLKAEKKWQRESRVLMEGGCLEHEFTRGA
jgi:hypothetical protein